MAFEVHENLRNARTTCCDQLRKSLEESVNRRHIEPSGECFYYHLKIEVFSETSRENLTYGAIRNSAQNINIPCPQPVKDTCKTFNGNFTWFKGKNLKPSKHRESLWVNNAKKDHEDIYTCICTWTHNHKLYNSSGSRRLFVLKKAVYEDVKIISPTTREQLVKKGSSIKLNCTVYCGINAERDCKTTWWINGKPAKQMDGYTETSTLDIKVPSKETFFTAILTIAEVSAEDFQKKFQCKGSGFYTTNSATLSLKNDESFTFIIVFLVLGVCLILFAAVVVKHFLSVRPYCPPRRCNKGTRC
ncbi:interleukin-1 receptor accessory protein-like [Poecilia formosa]|uniref:interleukin-1 receptor accessory protein-like n=1 Tax=Poecilia formosa TaxID=48698 RepID=UPI0007B91775|nr:PREDICTED: interleukin-1 receptor accessory protein-like [Poecilia formosa]